MAICTGIRDPGQLVVGIGRLVVAAHMAITAHQGGSGVSAGMAIGTGRNRMGPGKRESCIVVIETGGCVPGRMAGKTGRAAVIIPIHTTVLIIRVCFVVLVTIDATELTIIRRIGMAIRTLLPFSVVLA